MSKYFTFLWISFTILIITFMSGDMPVAHAQDDSIEFPGEIMSIAGDVIIVGGIAVDISNAILPLDGLTVGMSVQVIGTRQDQTISATIVVITDFGTVPTPAPTAVPEATQDVPTPDATEENTPDVNPTAVPTVVDSNGAPPIIVIEGPVQAISINHITIFDIDIQVDASDPILTQIRIGDTVRVAGESSFSGDTIIIVAVNITIIQTTIVIVQNPSPGVVYIPSLPPSCKRTKKGKVTCKKNSKKSS